MFNNNYNPFTQFEAGANEAIANDHSNLFSDWSDLTGECSLVDIDYKTTDKKGTIFEIRLKNREHTKAFQFKLPTSTDDLKAGSFKLGMIKKVFAQLCGVPDAEIPRHQTNALYFQACQMGGSSYSYAIRENSFQDKIYQNIGSLKLITGNNNKKIVYREQPTDNTVPF